MLNFLYICLMENEKKGKGRPPIYSAKLADEICEAIASSDRGLHFICKQNKHFPSSVTIFSWLKDKDKEYFFNQYARAKELQAEYIAEQILEIADDGSGDAETRYTADGEPYIVENKEFTNRSRLRVDARKWIASKLLPKKYGDKIQTEHSGSVLTITGMEIK